MGRPHRPLPPELAAALEGVRVLHPSRLLAGPWGTQTPADLGADVRAPPLLDQHPDEVLAELGLDERARARAIVA